MQLLTHQWLERLQRYDRLLVAYSGGLDSSVLLSCLASYPSIHPRLLAVHINHGISSNAMLWQKHCEQFCHQLNIPFFIEAVKFNRNSNIEEGARDARYAVFSRLTNKNTCLLLGHHLNDQAETVLLQLFRGTGIDGLSGMKDFDRFSTGVIARPFLEHSRTHLHHYALIKKLEWIDDESNKESQFARNYLRNEIMPLLQNKWPGVVNNVARTAIHCQQAKNNLYQLALQDCKELEEASSSLALEPLKNLSEERIINILRVWLKNNKSKLPSTINTQRIIKELLEAKIDAKPLIQWGDICIRRYQGRIYLEKKSQSALPKQLEWLHFPQPLALSEHSILSVKQATEGLLIPANAQITVKFRQGGERFILRGQTKELKKLFQEWKVPIWQRERIPLIYINNELAAVVGYAVSDLFYNSGSSALSINYI